MADMLTERGSFSTAISNAAGVAGTSALTGATLDMLGFDAVCCIVNLGPIVTGAVTSGKWQQDSDPAMGTAADLLGSGQTITDDLDNTIVVFDLKRPTKRYVRLVISRATQNATVGAATYIRYGARSRPPTQPAGVILERFVSPIEGTA